jgi:hypothetical protein
LGKRQAAVQQRGVYGRAIVQFAVISLQWAFISFVFKTANCPPQTANLIIPLHPSFQVIGAALVIAHFDFGTAKIVGKS